MFNDAACTDHVDEQSGPILYMRLNTPFTEAVSLMAPYNNTKQYAGNILATRVVELIFNGNMFTGVVPQNAPAGTVLQVEYAREVEGDNDTYYGYYALPVLGDIQVCTNDTCLQYPQGSSPDYLYMRINSTIVVEEGTSEYGNWEDHTSGGIRIEISNGTYNVTLQLADAVYEGHYHELAIGNVYAIPLATSGTIPSMLGVISMN